MTYKQKTNSRRAFSLLTTLALVFSVFVLPANADQANFSDVPPNHPYYDAVQFLKNKEIISGYSDGTFKPAGTINRAEAMKIILLGHYKWKDEVFPDNSVTEEVTAEDGVAEGTPEPKPIFSDVTNEWFAQYVNGAYKKGITDGYADGSFKPANNINKAESLKIILLAFTENETFSDPSKNPFPDVPFSSWYGKYVKYAKDKMLIDPDKFGDFNGGVDITRGEFADIIYRMMYISENDLSQYDPSVTWDIFDRSTQGYNVKTPPTWEVFEEINEHPAAGNKVRTMIWNKDEANKQRTYMRQFPNSAMAEIFISNTSLEKDKYFAEIRNAFGSDALIMEVETAGMPTLVVESENGIENILDSYIYMPSGKIANILGTYGNGSLAYKNSFYIRKLRENFTATDSSKIDDVNIEDILTIARENIQVDGKGQKTLDMFDDLQIIETDSIGVGTGPIDYNYSAKANITIKYERSFDVILDIENGRTSGF
ncbi:MAG: S-layer homology domain-containing protein [Candidatus Peregrinibacteria bacterium]|nr:S-layer homology domain-containing protein [Candidatus Peregrinibacteria bacterium]MDZ4245157.1 S-layer homology domain-containing protein [Candidatus Gracilibacteria bacterium]